MLDIRLVGTLAVRDGLMEETVSLAELPELQEREIVSKELYKEIRDQVQSAVRRQFTMEETDPITARNPITKNKFATLVDYLVQHNYSSVPESHVAALTERLFSDILGYGPIEKYFNDPDVTEIIVNSKNGIEIRIEKNGQEILVPEKFDSIDQGQDLVRRMIIKTGKRIDYAEPQVDARLHDGSRLKAHIDPVAPDKLLIAIRKFRQDVDVDKLIATNTVSSEVMSFLKTAIKLRLNMMITGGTSSGKTTWLNCLAGFIDKSLSIITIEDPAELQLQHPNVRRLEARGANLEGKGAYSLSDGVKDALRMAPKIIVLGECRGKEAFDLLQAMGTGHEGSMGTAHANDAEQFLNNRLPNMILMADTGLPLDAIKSQIADILDIVVHINKEVGGRRKLNHISEVTGVNKINGKVEEVASQRIWEYDRYTDSWKWVAKDFRYRALFEEAGWRCP